MAIDVTPVARRMIRSAADFLLPWSCVFCRAANVARRSDRHAACLECSRELTPELSSTCGRCSATVGPHVSTEDGCVHCRRQPIRFDSVVCLGMYDDPMRKAILSAKWSFSGNGIEALALLLAEARTAALEQFAADVIIPIPQSWLGRMTRRFNSASLIASVLSRSLRVPFDEHILRRRRVTRPQKRVSVEQRYQNQRDSFRLRDGHVIKGRRVLLVDDVLTTGATCSEAARMLKAEGAETCHVAVIARVLDSN